MRTPEQEKNIKSFLKFADQVGDLNKILELIDAYSKNYNRNFTETIEDMEGLILMNKHRKEGK